MKRHFDHQVQSVEPSLFSSDDQIRAKKKKSTQSNKLKDEHSIGNRRLSSELITTSHIIYGHAA